eukprot:TRINITY_DN4205_c0_g1_i2.p1 TRINITY_DN4205_c0_g1~~TRINITY_DN4205_c0_g1_i2.p1  ORF type:complete len:316 (+),score=70.76 TRINITY_DN4205_c0_g1_i2:516-1463(+)
MSQKETASEEVEMRMVLYIQMEYCGRTLETCLRERGAGISYEERLSIAYQVLEGLYALHTTYALPHRCISLQSVFVGKNGLVKIAGFGIATQCKQVLPSFSPLSIANQSPVLEIENSANHSASKFFYEPEILEEKKNFINPYEQAADIYSLGTVFKAIFSCIEATTSEISLKNTNDECVHSERPKGYHELLRLIKRMLSDNYKQRPSVEEIMKCKVFSKLKEHYGRHGNVIEGTFRIGTNGIWKTRYAKLYQKYLLLFNKRSTKAKYYYPLEKCNVEIYEKEGVKMLKVVHPNIETLFIQIGDSKQTEFFSHIHN